MSAIEKTRIVRVRASIATEDDDELAREEPLEIRIAREGEPHRAITVTMRTPGHDEELARGFLLSEGIIKNASDVVSAARADASCDRPRDNVVEVTLARFVKTKSLSLERNFFSTSSCGVCGKASIDALFAVVPARLAKKDGAAFSIDAHALTQIPDALRAAQDAFSRTGGLHATALFGKDFESTRAISFLREDVGRHNAFDKTVGAAMQTMPLPFSNHGAIVSGRASFELVQKALMAGIPMMCAVGAPSSLAVDLAKRFDMTLVGFLRGDRFNVYSGAHRIVTAQGPST